MIRIENIQAILDLKDIYFAIISEWNRDTEDKYYQYLYNEMHRLTPDVKKELRALEVNINQIPEYYILLERIEQIKKLFQETHKHQFIYHHVNSLKEYLDLTIKAKQIARIEPVKPKNEKKKQYKSYYRAIAIYFKMKFDYENKTIPEPQDDIYKLVENWENPDGEK